MWPLLSFPFALTLILSIYASPSQKPIAAHLFGLDKINSVSDVRRWWMCTPRCGASCSALSRSDIKSSMNDGSVPKLFQSESDEIYDRYAACLAATEGLRRIRDRTIQHQQDGELSQSNDKSRAKKNNREAEESALTTYVESASKVIESMGLPVSEFNEIGRKVCKDSALKEKVLEQAYLYRMQSSVHLDAMMEEAKVPSTSPTSKFDHFCQSMREIEHLRRVHAEQLKQTLGLDQLPSPLATNDQPTVRHAVETFSASADRIVQRHGLETIEFNQMLERMKRNPFFQSKVVRRIDAMKQ